MKKINNSIKKAISMTLALGVVVGAFGSIAYVRNGNKWVGSKTALNFLMSGNNGYNQSNYAAADWNAGMSNFTFMRSGSSNSTVSYGRITGAHSGALAITTTSTQGVTSDNYKKIIKAPVIVNSSYPWSEMSNTCSKNYYHLRSVLRHEYGHVLGLDHSGNTSSSMYYAISSGSIKGLSQDDYNGANAIYSRIASGAEDTMLEEKQWYQDEVLRVASENKLNANDVGVTSVCLLQPELNAVEAAREANAVIHGKVSKIIPGFSEDSGDAGKIYYSKAIIDVIDTYKGSVAYQVAVPMLGGSDGENVFIYHDAIKYVVGEDVILYLNGEVANNELSQEREASEVANVQTIGVVSNYKITLADEEERSAHNDNLSVIEQVKRDIAAAALPVDDSRDGNSIIVGAETNDVMLEEAD